ncbi:MAG: cyclophilin-like fold protein [Candidatus Bathyarchaeia archaeon]|jgi:hypothetical protein
MSVSHIPIKFVIHGIGEAEGEIIRIRSPRTADAILKALPIEGMSALWKEEIYFDIPVKMGNEKSIPTVEKGDLAYWPMGAAFCIFWGETQPYSPVNIIGKVTKNLELFQQVKSGTKIIIERLEPAT